MTPGVNPEIRNRIRLAVAAWAYEVENDPVLTDVEFDQLARIIDPDVDTGHPVMDQFFRELFDPETGLWVHAHPEPDGLRKAYVMLTKSYDELNNHDLFGPILMKPKKEYRRTEDCRRCRRDIYLNPAQGGCHC